MSNSLQPAKTQKLRVQMVDQFLVSTYENADICTVCVTAFSQWVYSILIQ